MSVKITSGAIPPKSVAIINKTTGFTYLRGVNDRCSFEMDSKTGEVDSVQKSWIDLLASVEESGDDFEVAYEGDVIEFIIERRGFPDAKD